MSLRRRLSGIFAACLLGTAALPALSQDTEPTGPAPATQQDPDSSLPDLDSFNVHDMINPVNREAMYRCDDNSQSCWTQAEVEAGAVREFQMMMMSTAYACNYKSGMEDLPEYYNTFIVRNLPLLQDRYNIVSRRFEAQVTSSPRDAARAQDTLDTANANIYAGAAAVHDEFCTTSSQLLRHVASLTDSAEVERIAHRVLLRPQAAAPTPARAVIGPAS